MKLIRFLPNHLWVYFFIFLFSNIFLSYFPMSWPEELTIALLGLVIPFSFAWATYNSRPGRSLEYQEFLTPVPTTVWILILILAVFFRFYKLTTLSVWPCYDEGFLNYYAFELSQKWDWRMFYGSSQAPPAYIWIQSFFFMWFGSSLQTIWFFPALVSALTLPLGYAASRQFFSKSFSFLLLLLMVGSFWPLYAGRFSLMTSLIPFWECLALYLLGVMVNASDRRKMPWSILLGLVVGTGFYIHLSWIPISVVIGFAVLIFEWNKKTSLFYFCFFMMTVVLTFLPLIFSGLNQNYGFYLKDLWAFSKSGLVNNQFQISMSYFTSLFWGLLVPFCSYEPVWGGLLNPLLGALFFLGLLKSFMNRWNFSDYWLIFALLAFMVPVCLTKTVESFRILPVMVVIFLMITRGLVWLLSVTSKPWRSMMIGTILALSFGLDFFHLEKAYGEIWKTPLRWLDYGKSLPRYRAYELLKETSSQKGPGLIFSDFVPGYSDETLTLADYSFNAAENSRLSWKRASWAAVLVNAHYLTFLLKRFPDGKAFFLSKDLPTPNGGWMLWVMPADIRRQVVLKKWMDASLALRPFIDQYISYVNGRSFQPVEDSFLQAQSAFEGDPFLESVFWEKTADNELKMNDPGHRLAIQAIEKAIKKGYPAAHLYYDLGMFYWMDQNRVAAQQAFEKAVRSPIDFTDSNRMLQQMR